MRAAEALGHIRASALGSDVIISSHPKHLNYMYDFDANRCDGATQRAE
jgi:hypothetical protein